MTELDPQFNILPPKAFVDPHNFHIHLVGIGGVAMASLAGLLLDAGFKVTGSDGEIYEPMKGLLKELSISVTKGYEPETLPQNTDLVVIGNVVTREFPVLKAIAAGQTPYLSLPQCLEELFLNATNNLVVAGSHGKTTTTAMCAKLMDSSFIQPGFLVGGATLDFPRPWRQSKGAWFVIEGDEYDSAFFEKKPKFLRYRPHTVILTSVEFDHGDIYPDLAAVMEAFTALMEIIPPHGRLIAYGDDPRVREIAAKTKAQTFFYGQNQDNDWRLDDIQSTKNGLTWRLYGPQNNSIILSLPRPGVYNALNASAATAAFLLSGGEAHNLALSLKTFRGVRRRQETEIHNDIVLVDDFAHHPTAVKATISAMRQAWPQNRLLVAFEPRSNTSRRAFFQADYAEALAGADFVFLREPGGLEKIPPTDRLDAAQIVADLNGKAELFTDGQTLGEAILQKAQKNDTILVMSNGGFDGLVAFLRSKL